MDLPRLLKEDDGMSDDADDLVADIQAAAAESLAVLTGSRPCALYRIFTADDRLLYVGISTGPAARIKQHENDKPWWIEARRITIEPFDTAEEAAQAERHAIATEKPVHNISGGARVVDHDERARRRAERERRQD